MLSSLLFALALAQAAPAPAGPTPAAPADAAAAPILAAPDDSGVPRGAPSDDYGLVAWCRGALTGHMALYTVVKPELKSIERPGEVASDERDDKAQLEAGRDYLALYHRAMMAAEKAHPSLRERGETVMGQGEAIWTAVKAAPPRTRMWSWLMWDLPGRCEVAANRLETRSGLLGAAFKDNGASEAQPAADTAPAAADPGVAAPVLRPPQ